MEVKEFLLKAEQFAVNFIEKISDKTESAARKQVYFLDNQEDLTKYMSFLQKTIVLLSDSDESSNDNIDSINKAEEIVENLKTAITEYQKELNISSDISEEDTTVIVTEDTISQAMHENKTTQEISTAMQALTEELGTTPIYSHALVCDDELYMFKASDNTRITEYINSVANKKDYKEVKLYKLSFTPVELKKKTVFTV